MLRHFIGLSFALWLASAGHAVAQGGPQATPAAAAGASTPNTQEPTAAAAELDVSVPESPAFTVLGVSPQEITRPATPRALATALITAVGRDGDVQRGLAIDTAPYLLAFGNDLTLNDYKASRSRRVLAGTTLSIATTTEEGEEADQRVAVGLRVTLFDRGDPRLDSKLNECLAAALRTALPAPGLVNSTTLTKSEKLRDCREKSQKRNWNSSSWIVAAAPSWISEEGSAGKLAWNGYALWTSASWGFEGIAAPWLQKHAQLIGHIRLRTNETVKVEEQEIAENNQIAGVRFRAGVPNVTGSVEAAYERHSGHPDGSYNSSRVSLGLEQRLAENVWLHVSLGRAFGDRQFGDSVIARSTFNWSFGRKD